MRRSSAGRAEGIVNPQCRRFDSGPAHHTRRKEARPVKFARDLVLFCTVFCGGGYGLIFLCTKMASMLDIVLCA